MHSLISVIPQGIVIKTHHCYNIFFNNVWDVIHWTQSFKSVTKSTAHLFFYLKWFNGSSWEDMLSSWPMEIGGTSYRSSRSNDCFLRHHLCHHHHHHCSIKWSFACTRAGRPSLCRLVPHLRRTVKRSLVYSNCWQWVSPSNRTVNDLSSSLSHALINYRKLLFHSQLRLWLWCLCLLYKHSIFISVFSLSSVFSFCCACQSACFARYLESVACKYRLKMIVCLIDLQMIESTCASL